ncbi:MAG: glycosyltransferase family 4 protein [Alphaproteobacteria bacterium]
MDNARHAMTLAGKTILFLVSEDWYFCSHRLRLARAAKQAGADVAVACRVRDHGAAIEAEGFHLYPLPFDRSRRNVFADLATLLKIRKLYTDLQPDIVHQVAMKPVLYGSIAAWLSGVPAVVNALGGLGYLFINRSLPVRVARAGLGLLFRVLLNRRNSLLIVQNPDDAALFENRIGIDASRIRIIRGAGVDTVRFAPGDEPVPPPVIALCVSRMLWDKGIGELVEAARLLKTKGVPLRVRLAGPRDDNPASIPQSTMDAWAAEDVVDILGPRTDIADLYRETHIAVLPSYREGLPKSLLEAAACGKPMVATDVPGCREVCRNGETGLSVPARAVEPLADALERLATDADLRKALGAAARRAAETEFAEDIIHDQTLRAYGDALD